MKILASLWPKRKVYNIKVLDSSKIAAAEFPNALEDMTVNRIDGFIVKNFLTEKECLTLIDGFEKLENDRIIEAEKGFSMYPTPFAKFNHLYTHSNQEYIEALKESEEIWTNFPAYFGVNFYSKLKLFLEEISGERVLKMVPGERNIGHFNPAGFKRLDPNQGKFTVHCGNYFHDEFQFFFSHLKQFIPIEKQLSYFVTLQAPTEGGDIILYDVKWDDAEERLSDGKIIRKKDGTELAIDDEKQLKRIVLKPEKGDLLIFASAQIWHKVTKPVTSRRYTLGGFLGISHDKQSVYIWS